jgi:hypothetical protein
MEVCGAFITMLRLACRNTVHDFDFDCACGDCMSRRVRERDLHLEKNLKKKSLRKKPTHNWKSTAKRWFYVLVIVDAVIFLRIMIL